MKISIVQGAFLPVPPVMGGAVEKIWYALGREFARRGHRVTHLSRAHPDLPDSEEIDGVRHRRVAGFDTPSNRWMLKLYDLLYTRRVVGVLPEADVLVSNTFWLPVLVRSSRFGELYVHVARYPKGQMFLYRHAARIQAVSEPVARAVRGQLPGRVRRKVRAIPNPLPPGVPIDRSPPSLEQREREILYVGRLHSEKGIELLVRAFHRFVRRARSGWRLVLVGPWQKDLGGEGPSYRDRLRKLAKEGAGRVRFEGPIFEDDALYAYHRRARLFVYPSLAEQGESFGLAPLEAMACGCPPVVSNLDCFGDFISDGVNGLVFDHRSERPEQKLAAAMHRAVESPSTWRELAENARDTAAGFELSDVATRYLADFASIVDGERTTSEPIVSDEPVRGT